jgi:hypothetical protein
MITIVALAIIPGIIALIVILLHFPVTAKIKLGDSGLKIKVDYLWFDIYPRKSRKKKKKKTVKRKESRKPLQENSESFDDDFDSEISDYELMHGETPTDNAEQAEDTPNEIDNSVKNSETENDESEQSEPTGKSVDKTKAVPKKNKKVERNKKDKSSGKLSQLKKKYERYKPYIPVTWRYFKKLLKSIRIKIDDVRLDVGREDAHEAAIYYGIVQSVIAQLLSFLSSFFTVNVSRCDVNCVFTENKIDGTAKLVIKARPSALIAILVCYGINFLKIKHQTAKSNKQIHEPKVA